MTPYQTYHSAAYRRFKAIPPNAFREIVRYYEENETAVGQLDFEEYFEITLAYTEALFECGKYREHLVMADPVLETVIRQNIFLVGDRDIFRDTLLRKGASLYHVGSYRRAEAVLGELIRIEPHNKACGLLLKRCCRKLCPGLVNITRAISVFLALVIILLLSVEFLFARPFYPIYVPLLSATSNTLLISGALILAGGEAYRYIRSELLVRKAIKLAARKKEDAL
ncbi:MAG: hypothetical protein H6562_03030 [Lewinellaceae bacterium]|nr:hypothetical protein [Lewinella sp.]MCB9277863.1 hypothetical protein [Lewinellaceae bacterium]HMQ86767.1 hypothetical protein [Flavilitoribacter sp.]